MRRLGSVERRRLLIRNENAHAANVIFVLIDDDTRFFDWTNVIVYVNNDSRHCGATNEIITKIDVDGV